MKFKEGDLVSINYDSSVTLHIIVAVEPARSARYRCVILLPAWRSINDVDEYSEVGKKMTVISRVSA